MKLGFIGLGKMGFNMVQRLLEEKHEVVAFDLDKKNVKKITKEGATGAHELKEMIEKLETPRTIWIMVPQGKPVDSTLESLTPLLSSGDTIIDGGNSFFKDSLRRFEDLKSKGIHFVDVGVSGGIAGARKGACLMVGGEKEVYETLKPLYKSLAQPEGYGFMGKPGSGHYVKMVHNGIEYGMMEAYVEGFELLKTGPFQDLDLTEASRVWNTGSIIESYLLSKVHSALSKDEKLKNFTGCVPDTGEGRWTIQTAIESGIDVPVLAFALFRRFASRKDMAYSDKLLSALRFEFGGHAECVRK